MIKIIGGALLVWIVNDLRQDLFGEKKKIKSPTKASKEPSFVEGMYKVIIADINETSGQEVADQINNLGGKAKYIKTDVSNEDSMKNLIDSLEKIGPIPD